MAGKRKVPAQLKQHAFKPGSAKATKAGAKGGRKSPGAGKTASATTTSAMPAKKTTKAKGAKRTTAKRTRKS